MATDKSGMWFLELILNILLLAGVALVTFAARAEQERGLAVPLFAAVSPATTRPAVEPAAPRPTATALPSPTTLPQVDAQQVTRKVAEGVKNAAPQVQAVTATGIRSFNQAWGALEIWAAGLDGTISAEELKRIQDSIAQGWDSTQPTRDYLRSVNQRISAGQADQVVQEALGVLSQQANEKKVLVMKSVVDFMKSNGITWEQTQQVMGRWVVQVLKLSPMDVVNFVKSLDK